MTQSENHLQRFHQAQANTYQTAYHELQQGLKQSHWMWFVFPQIGGLGFSETSRRYAIQGLQEAEEYLQDPLLADRLIRLCHLLLDQEGKTAHDIFGSPDDLKLRSSMTLFSAVKPSHPVFQKVLDKYFKGQKDPKTLELLGRH